MMKSMKLITSVGALAIATLTLGSTLTFAATNSNVNSNGVNTPPAQGQQMGKRRPPAPVSLSEFAQALNLSSSTLFSDLKSGQSLLDIATQQGISESALEQTLTTYVDNQIQTMVSSGKLTSTQATNAEAAFAKRLPTLLSHKGLPPKLGQGPMNGRGRGNGQTPTNGQGGLTGQSSANGQGAPSGQQMGKRRPPAPIPPSELAMALNISTSTLHSDLQSGQSLLDIATTQGISESALEQTLTTYVDNQIQTMVSSGKLTSTQATNAESAFAKRLPTMLSHKGLLPRPGKGKGQGPLNGQGLANGQGSTNSQGAANN